MSPFPNPMIQGAYDEATRPGHECMTPELNRPCFHHQSAHCLACCILDRHDAIHVAKGTCTNTPYEVQHRVKVSQ